MQQNYRILVHFSILLRKDVTVFEATWPFFKPYPFWVKSKTELKRFRIMMITTIFKIHAQA